MKRFPAAFFGLGLCLPLIFFAACESSEKTSEGIAATDLPSPTPTPLTWSSANARITIVGPDGSEVTSLDVADPVAAKLSGLEANTQYIVRTVHPNGTTVCEAKVYSDADGTIPVASYCYLGDRDTDVYATDGRVNTLKKKDLTIPTGDFFLRLLTSNSFEIIKEAKIPIAKERAWACASNSAGKCARSFLKTASNVYAMIRKGTGVASGEVVDIYVIGDRCNIGYAIGSSLQDFSGGKDTVTVTYTSGVFTTSIPIWANPANAGVYDLVIDVDQSGTFTEGDIFETIDPVPADPTNPGGLCAPGFTVQDAYSAGTDVIMQIAMDKNRAYQDVFSKARKEDVYAQVQSQRRLTHDFRVKNFVVAHQDTWTDGDVLTDVIPPTWDEVQSGCTNQQRRLIAPVEMLDPGCYDVVFDVDGDGVYDKGGDAIDNIDLSRGVTCGFIVSDDDFAVTINSIKDTDDVEVRIVDGDETSSAISSKMDLMGKAKYFTTTATVKAYAIRGNQQGGAILGTVGSDGAFTVNDVPVFSGANVIKVEVTELLHSGETQYASATAGVTWTPGGASGGIDILATITWLALTDMDTHFIKTGGSYDGRSATTNYEDCHYTNCSQAGGEALLWTTAAGTQTTASDTSSDSIARLDLDCIGCAAKTENVWIKDAAGVVDKAGNFLLCVVAFSGTDTPTAQVSVNGIAQIPMTAPSSISSSSGNDMWFAGYVAQDASGNLAWHAVNAVGVGAAVCAQP